MKRGVFFVLGVVVIVALAGLLLASICGCGSSSTLTGLNVLPFLGTPDASPESQIAFPALAPADLASVTVRGSRSGSHRGQLSALPNGRGVAFVPDNPFAAGERVTVRALLGSALAGTASDATGARQITFAFTVATPPRLSTTSTSPPRTAAKPPPTWSFHSRPGLHPPVVTVSTPDADPSAGDVFVDARNAPQDGAMILDGQGNLVWYHPGSVDDSPMDLRVQSYQGQPVLTWWQGEVTSSGHGLGKDMIVNESYQPVATVHAGEGYEVDLHEFQITPENTALITIYQPAQADLSSSGGPRQGTVFDSIIQEVDIKTGRVLWEWHALGHVPVSASYLGKPTASRPDDFFHINSIQEIPGDNLIVSSRDTWTVYEISRKTGAIIWQLGGKDNSFKMRPGTQFEWQHDARMQADGTLTLFDNGANPKEEAQSRALHLKLDTQTMRATLIASYTHTPPLVAGTQGDMQVLPNGNVFVGWGDQPNFSEFTASGRMIFDARFPIPVQSYRALRFPWTGHPSEPPAISVTSEGTGAFTAYASWNGATNVARWQLLAGPTPSLALAGGRSPCQWIRDRYLHHNLAALCGDACT